MKMLCSECRYDSILTEPNEVRHFATCSHYKRVCMCGKPSLEDEAGNRVYPMGECSKECMELMWTAMQGIKRAMDLQPDAIKEGKPIKYIPEYHNPIQIKKSSDEIRKQ